MMPFRNPCKGFGIPVLIEENAHLMPGNERYSPVCKRTITKLAVKIWDRGYTPNSKEVTKTPSAVK